MTMRMIIPKRFLCALLLLCGVMAVAEDPLDEAVKRLSQAGIYALGGVGFAGGLTQATRDYMLISSLPKAEAEPIFVKLYATGNAQAKAYALHGMKQVNPARFKELAADAEKSTAMVGTGRGCVLSREPLSQIAAGLDH